MKRITPTGGKDRIIAFFKTWGSLIFSLILFIGSIGIYAATTSQQEVTYVQYLVAGKDIAPLTPVSQKDLSLVRFPSDSTPPNAIRKEDANKIVGQKTVVTIHKGDLFTPSFFGVTNVGKGNNIASVLPSGMRLQYFNVADFHSIPPDLQKQNKIDIYAVPQGDGKTSKVLTNALVFDVLKGKTDSGEGIILVGLLLDEDQSLAISSYLTNDWTLQLVLRSDSDNTEVSQTINEKESSPSATPKKSE